MKKATNSMYQNMNAIAKTVKNRKIRQTKSKTNLIYADNGNGGKETEIILLHS